MRWWGVKGRYEEMTTTVKGKGANVRQHKESTEGGVQIEADERSWRKGTAAALAVVPARSPNPAVEGILLDHTKAGFTSFVGTDLSTFVVAHHPAGAHVQRGGGRLIVPAAFAQIPGPIVIEEKGDLIHAEARGTVYAIPKLEAADYPEVPAIPWVPEFNVEKLVTAIRKVLPAVGKDKAQAPLCGVLITPKAVVATDAFLLHVAWIPEGEWNGEVWAPDTWAQVVAKALDDSDAPIGVVCGGDHLIALDSNGIAVATPFAEANYPGWLQMIERGEPDAWVVVNAADMLAAIRAIGIVATAQFPCAVMRLEFGEQYGAPGEVYLALGLHDGEHSDRTARSSAVAESGEAKGECEVAAELKYLIAALEAAGNVRVCVEMWRDPTAPIIIRDIDGADGAPLTAVVSSRG